MNRSRTSHARERRAAPKRVEAQVRKPTGGGRFFRAIPRSNAVPDVEHIRDVFRRLAGGLGKRLG